jgi:hypothetical protein
MKKVLVLSFWLGLFCTCGLIFNSVPSLALTNERKLLIEVEIDDPSDIQKLQQMNIDIATERLIPPIQVIVTERQLRELSEYGWRFRVVIEDLEQYFEENIDVDGNLGAYHTYEEMVEEMSLIAERYPEITRLIDIGDSWEKTQGMADRDIWAIKISDNPDLEEDAEPDVLIVGCHHARELISVEIPLAIVRALTDKYPADARIKYLVDNREVWIIPMLNPDGHVYVEEVNSTWRKNRNTNGNSNSLYQGVDLNRNYGFKWGYDNTGSSPQTKSETYRGTAPFSEPETQAIKDLIEEHDFALGLSYHSYGNLFLFPWGYIDEDTEDNAVFERLGRIYCKQNEYIYGNAKDGIIYNTNGDMDDWAYGEQETKNKILSMTVEVGDSFQPPCSEIPKLIEENLKPALRLIFAAGRL